jgi:hypothetical protein
MPMIKREGRLSLALIMTLLMQAAGVLIWATQLEARVGAVEQQGEGTSSLNEKFARLDERLDGMKEDIAVIRRQMENLTTHLME